jgi:hypothetical protein
MVTAHYFHKQTINFDNFFLWKPHFPIFLDVVPRSEHSQGSFTPQKENYSIIVYSFFYSFLVVILIKIWVTSANKACLGLN